MIDQPKPSLTPVMVPPQPVGTRRCSNCACCYTVENPAEGTQYFCGAEPPNCAPVRLEVPRLDKDGKPMFSRMDPAKPLTDAVQGYGFAHRPTQPNLVCFNGWRPLDARPGERAGEVRYRRALEAVMPTVRQIVDEAKADLPPEQAARLEAVLLAVDGALDIEPAASAGEPPLEKPPLNS